MTILLHLYIIPQTDDEENVFPKKLENNFVRLDVIEVYINKEKYEINHIKQIGFILGYLVTFWNDLKINQFDADKIKLKNLQKLLRKGCTNLFDCGII